MSSIIKKTSSRFAPKLTQRKQSRGPTPTTSKAGTPVVQKVVQIEEATEIIPNEDVEDDEEEDVEEANDDVPPVLKRDIFDSKDTNNDSNEAIMDEDEDPHKKSTTVIIHPPNKVVDKSRRSSSVTTGVSFRRGSINDDNRRMRRLSSITSGLSSGMGILRRQSVSSAAGSADSTPAPQQPTRISVSDTSSGPVKINIPTGAPPKQTRTRTKSTQKSLGKLPVKRRSSRTLSVGPTDLLVDTTRESTVALLESAVEEEEDVAEKDAESDEAVKYVIPEASAEPSQINYQHVGSPQLLEEEEESDLDDEDLEGQDDSEPKEVRHTIKRKLGAGGISLAARRTQVKRTKKVVKLKKAKAKKLATTEHTIIRKSERIPLDLDSSLKVFIDAKGALGTRAATHVSDPSMENKITNIDHIPRYLLTSKNKLFNEIKIDEDKFVMEDLCKPVFPFGEVSENFDQARLAADNKKKLLKERRQQRMKARTNGVRYSDYLEEEEKQALLKRRANAPVMDSAQALSLKVDQAGAVVLDEASAYVDRHRDQNHDDREKIIENAFENPVISSTYGKRVVTDRWTPVETRQFYEALSSWGTDFNIITQLFPHRDRRQVKLKFNLEERKHPYIIDLALKRKLPIDFENYCATSKQQFKTLEEYNQELKELKEKHEREVKEMLEALEKQRKEDAEVQRKREVEIRTGVKSMSRAERRAELRKNEVVIGEVVKNAKEEE